MRQRHQPGSRPGGGRAKRPPFLFIIVLITLSAATLILISRKPAGGAVVITREETVTTTQPRTASSFPVHVDGAVNKPGIYYFRDGDIWEEAIERAGGLTDPADRSMINLAMLLQPHMKVYIPEEGELIPGLAADPFMESAGGKIDLNRASREQLESLPGVGAATSEAIVAYREEHGPFLEIEDLMQVPGIKEGRFSKLKDKIYVTGP